MLTHPWFVVYAGRRRRGEKETKARNSPKASVKATAMRQMAWCSKTCMPKGRVTDRVGIRGANRQHVLEMNGRRAVHAGLEYVPLSYLVGLVAYRLQPVRDGLHTQRYASTWLGLVIVVGVDVYRKSASQ